MPVAPPIPQKTPLGVEAQRKRTADLGQRHRTILFLVDGRRTLSEVLALAKQAGAATTHFEDLVRLGYIEVPQPDFPNTSQAMPLDEAEGIADSLEIDVPPPAPLLLGEDAVVSPTQLQPAPAPAAAPPAPPTLASPVAATPSAKPAEAPVTSAPAAAPAAPPPAPVIASAAAPVAAVAMPPASPPPMPRPAVVSKPATAPREEPRAAVRPAPVAAPPVPAPPAPARRPAVAAPAPAPKAVPRPAPAPVAAPPAQPKAAKVRAPTIISSHGLAPAGKPTAASRTLRVIPPATHDEEDVLGEVRACLLETVRLDGAAFGRRIAARVKQAEEPSDFIGLVWELERETSHARRSREGLWNLQRARELLGLGNTLVAEDSRPNWPDSE